jgi:hypothetical protein
MASVPARRRRGHGWLLTTALFGAVALSLGAGLRDGATPLTAVRSGALNPVRDGVSAYSRPHVTPVGAAAVPSVAPVAAPAAHRATAPATHAVAALAARPVSAPTSYRNRLISADGTLNTFVGYYGDCSGRTALTRSSAAIDTCVGGRTYFVGHNPGVFTPLFHMGVGTIITWYDGGGRAHRLRVIGVRTVYRSAGVPSLLAGAVAEFQTCIAADGSVDRLLDAAPA